MAQRPPSSPDGRRKDAAGRWHRLWEKTVRTSWVWAVLFLVGLTGIFLLKHATDQPLTRTYDPGDIVLADVKAPVTFEFHDEERTRAERRKAREAVPPVYDFNSRTGREALEELRRAFGRLRKETRDYFASIQGPPVDSQAPPHPVPPPERILEAAQDAFPQAPEEALVALYRHGFPARLEKWILDTVETIHKSKIAASVEGLREGNKIAVRDVHSGAEWEDPQPARTLSLEEGRAQVASRAEDLPPAELTEQERTALASWAAGYVRPTLSPNVRETEIRRARAAERVAPVVEVVPKGKIIVREGEEVSPYQAALLQALARRTVSPRDWRSTLGYAGLSLALLVFLWVFLERGTVVAAREDKPVFPMVVTTTLFAVASSAVALYLADVLTETLQGPWAITQDTLRYALPWAAGSMALALLVSRPVAVAYTMIYSILMGLYLAGNYPLTLFCLLSGLAGAFAVDRVKKRADAARGCLRVGLVNVALVLILHAFSPWLAGGRWSWWDYAAALGGGAFVLVVFHLLFPILEHAFGVLTDVRLLELGDPENRLLRELAIRAPGTYQHSIAVGRLAESAAEAIGANALFCRVAALYHDVGKMRKPEYFIENQRDGINPHERLTPHMSTLIIVSHVKDGLKLTRREGIPKPLRDVIPQHHGTRLITYFYKKAGEPADDAEFRYPGPKPQTREAAIFMLADGVEAAARTLQNPTPARCKGMIRQVTNAVMLDGQLDQCDLSFKEIDRIQDAFLKIILSMHHGRIDYPGFEFETKKARRGSEKVVRFPPGTER